MKRSLSLLLYVCSALITLQVQAIVNGHEYQFEEESKAEIFRHLANELRCPKCQNQNLADSNAMIADDLRRELYQQVKEGKGSEEIVDFMVNRYGDFVLYRPKVNAMTYVLWYGPAALCVIAALVFALVMRNRRREDDAIEPETAQATAVEADTVPKEEFSAEEQARLNSLLDDEKNDSDPKGS